MSNVTEQFSSMVFDDATMEALLPKQTYRALQKTIKNGAKLDEAVATVVANAMKDWAIGLGATHYTHWFQPMTGVTAEKHDSFISPKDGGKIIMEFSGKELMQGEPDASSFPSGGIRATFEARGYTAWDATSYAFVKEGVLYIPTVFCSYGGEALDQKTALLRSMEAISKQAVRILRLFGNEEVTQVKTTVGPEQEYFLVDKELYDQRKDLIYTGRTLFGCRAPKGQELDDHYFGAIKPRVKAYMKELNDELWKLGVLAKTEHNEVAPAQHELAPVFSTTNIASDHNQLTMEIMQKIAKKHGMVCLLHEKPFAGVNGSGKHNNWSISTDTGINLLDPGETPYENAQFLLFLAAVIKAVDEYQDLIRISVASAGNDHRLGANEAPPAIVSMFLGTDLQAVVDAIMTDKPYAKGTKETIKLGVNTIPKLPKDTTDRNRTSPFAFTGNKFELRSLGSSDSISCCNTVLNTAVAEVLDEFATQLEKAKDFEAALHKLVQKTFKDHKRIIFNGDGYDESWVKEAEKRGLSNLKTTPDALAHLLDKKNVDLFKKHNVFSEVELQARHEVRLENYSKIIHIEALTMLDMANKDILPAMSKFTAELADAIAKKSAAKISAGYEKGTLKEVADHLDAMYKAVKKLEADEVKGNDITDVVELADFCRDVIIPDMEEVRAHSDAMEMVADSKVWPYPSYGKLLFGVR
ncbi:MAG: glutamine synthetase III [Lachnospiraceae bacterium]|nr:glutamine synthetase III [Lachnospiraceae bacterium]MDD7224329.1 glutamine synthetase III [Lachnospiraceae bacterium]MDY3254367.1 glutamine synthetase III [Lachnospiraceae bacterium]